MKTSRIGDMRNLSPAERLAKIREAAELGEDSSLGSGDALTVERANGMIENVVGTFQLPLGIATNFVVNERDYLVPMAVEEPSVVAAASFMAKIVRGAGGFKTSSTPPVMRAQIQLLGASDPYGARMAILSSRQEIIAAANEKDPVLAHFGGGCRDLEVQVFPSTTRGAMVVLHLLVDVRDAMGANTVNTMAEAIAPIVERITGGEVRLRILSNLADLRLARSRVELTEQDLATREFSGRRVMDGIMDAYELAAVDPYRAATHNKGIMNGIDPVVIATGNDWRAVEAGAHAFAARGGRYTSLTTWEISGAGTLVGTIEMPMALGLVGGATKTHPGAQSALRMMNVKNAAELAEVVVSVGLAQNMAALRALATEGIQRGHMALHARNIAIGAGATGSEIDHVAERLASTHEVGVARAQEILAEIRRRGEPAPVPA